MGRVSKYKKVKSSVDRYGTGFGFNDSFTSGSKSQKIKKRSLTAKAHLARKQKRGKRDQYQDGFNLPPSSKKDDFDLNDLVGSITKEKQISPQALLLMDDSNANSNINKNSVTCATLQNDNRNNHDEITQEAKQMVRELKLNTTKSSLQKSSKESSTMKRQEGESMNAFRKRVKDETRKIMKQTMKSKNNDANNSGNGTTETTALSAKQQKKKEFLKNKKNKKKNKRDYENDTGGDDDDDNEYYLKQRHRQQQSNSSSKHTTTTTTATAASDEDASFITGERAVAAVRSGALKNNDQVERPPIFAQLPRGAKPKNQMSSSNSCNSKKKKSGGMNDSQIQAEQNAMEKMRQKVQAQYAVMKQKRKRAGDFHL